MKKYILFSVFIFCSSYFSYGQGKTIIGIMPFNGQQTEEQSNRYSYRNKQQETSGLIVAIQDAVTDAFVKTKRFSLVEREKMGQIKYEKNLQKGEDFIDGSVIEQSKSLGAQYVVMGNVSKASVEKSQTNAPYAGTITRINSEVAFNIKIVDVVTGLIMASNSFSGKGKGENALESALNDIRPEIVNFIKENFKVTLPVASIEEKDKKGNAVKLLIAGGSSLGIAEKNELKVFEVTEIMVDGKKMTRKIPIGKVRVEKVEDENFSVCIVSEGGGEIAKKMENGAKIKCELLNDLHD